MELQEACQLKSISVDSTQLSQLNQFAALVIQYNQKTNLISVADEAKIYTRHVLDSLMLTTVVAGLEILDWVDMGSGAGFPVIPLAIYFPKIQFVAVEPRLKRQTFLKTVIRSVGLTNLKVFCGTAEDYIPNSADIVSCRALGSADEDWSRATTILKNQGRFMSLKSERDAIILDQSNWQIVHYSLPEELQTYSIVIRNK